MLIIMAGLPGTGKTTLARELAKSNSATILNKDLIRSALFAPDQIEYSVGQDDFCFQIMLDTASYLLRKHREYLVFLDGRTFSRTYQVDQAIAAAETINQPWRIIECLCSNESARRRLEEQSSKHVAADRDYSLYLRIKSAFQEITRPKLVIDTDQPIEQCVRAASKALAQSDS